HKVPSEPGYTIPNGTTAAEIASFEARTGIKIPAELAEWLKLSNGAVVGPGGLFGVRPERSDMDIEEMYRLYPEWKTKGWIPIGGDGSGNYYLTTSDTESRYAGHPVFFVDTHEDPDVSSFIVASNVWSFLCFLLEHE